MMCYSYNFGIPYGMGTGIVFAENKEKARELIKENDGYYKTHNLVYETDHEITLEEIRNLNDNVISFSYEE